MSSPLLDVAEVTRRFVSRAETVVALDAVSFHVDAGEIVGLVGPSGSGKSTLLHIVLGWDDPDGGRVRRGDGDADARQRIGWAATAVVPQELGLLPELTARQNVELAARIGGAGRSDQAGRHLEDLGLGELAGRLPGELSLGEQQRVAVARAVICEPTLLVADEPTAHQDEANADAVMNVLAAVADRGGAVLLATHDDRLLGRVDRVLRLLDGHLSEDS